MHMKEEDILFSPSVPRKTSVVMIHGNMRLYLLVIMTTYIVPRTNLGYYESLKHAIIYACDIRRQ